MRELPRKDPTVFQRSRVPRELVDMARIYAVSKEPADQAVVLQQLNSKDFLERLNTPQQYLALQPRALDAARVVKTLMDQAHPPAVSTLVSLTQATVFQSNPSLVELNILALSVDRPARPQTIAYWDRHSHPLSSNVDLVVQAIFANRSEPALRLFERKMNDPAQDDLRKLTWLRDPLLLQRNDAQVLRFCGTAIVQKTLLPKWHNPLLEALFDYNEGWYLSCKFPRPPNRMLATPEAKEIMGRLGEYALTRMQILIPGLAAKIRLVLKEIGYKWDENRKPT